MKRFNDSALGALERPLLAWIADRIPARIEPDHLTLFGFAGALIAAAGYVASRWSLAWLWLASAGLAMHWAGDSLDGTLARRRNIQRPRYGFFLDHTSDLFAQTLVFLALGLSPCARFGIACLALIAFLMAFVYSLIGVAVHDTMRITYFGFGPTEIRLLLIAGNLITVFLGLFDVRPWLVHDLDLGLLTHSGPVTLYEAVIVAFFAVSLPALALLALRERRTLALGDPARLPAPTPAIAPETSAL